MLDRQKKWIQKHGTTKVVSFLPPSHPVVVGVIETKKYLGGSFPDHVGEIHIRPEVLPYRQKDDMVVNGRCLGPDRGRSKIEIYAGSIHESSGGEHLEESHTIRVTLHEIAHSKRDAEIQYGAWIGRQPSRKWWEDDAEEFASKTITDFHQRKCQNRSRKMWEKLDQKS